MAPRGITEFYYTQDLPARSVAIAQVQTSVFAPSDLVDFSNTPFQQGDLGVWKSISNLNGPADFIAPDYNQSITISGDSSYYINNQFYQLTAQAVGGVPLYFYHPLPLNVTGVTILDLNGVVQVAPKILISGQFLYHDMGGAAFRVRYINAQGFLVDQLLQYNPALTEAPYAPSATAFVRTGRSFAVNGTSAIFIRFLKPNGYQLTVPYNTLPNTPWFMRVSYGLNPVAPEWARQLFLPQRPYMLAAWVPGTVLNANVIEFERKKMLVDQSHLPDILVFDKTGTLKYALDGTAPGSPRRRGTLYPWKRGHIKSGVDSYNSRVEVTVDLDPTDIVYGFYAYNEQDVLYTALDVNPFTNPAVKNRVIKFLTKTAGSTDPFTTIYHEIYDQNGVLVFPLQNNLLLWTEDFTNAVWSKATTGATAAPTVTPDFVVAPDGVSLTADKLVFATTDGTSNLTVSQNVTVPLTTKGSFYCFSIWLRADSTISNANFSFYGRTGGPFGSVWNNTTFSSNASLANGASPNLTTQWQQFWYAGDAGVVAGTTITATLRLGINATGLTVYAWGAQMEPGTQPSSYNRVDGPVTKVYFSQMVVGGSVGTSRFTVTDVREEGGGLQPQWQTLPASVHFWDLGYWDGKPYPADGGLIVHLPSSVLGELSKADIQTKIESILPMGVIPVVFYYDPDGTESR